MRFQQIRTGTVLETGNKDAIAIMRASDAYVQISDALPATGPGAPPEEDSGPLKADEERGYSGEDLEAMTVNEIREIAVECGYTLSQGRKTDLIAEFLAAQSSDTQE